MQPITGLRVLPNYYSSDNRQSPQHRNAFQQNLRLIISIEFE